jgi:hypothetical protein
VLPCTHAYLPRLRFRDGDVWDSIARYVALSPSAHACNYVGNPMRCRSRLIDLCLSPLQLQVAATTPLSDLLHERDNVARGTVWKGRAGSDICHAVP